MENTWILVGFVIILGAMVIPQSAFAQCPPDDMYNYTQCLENSSLSVWDCACCVVQFTGSPVYWSLSTNCDANISTCDKPIGIAIIQKKGQNPPPIEVTGEGSLVQPSVLYDPSSGSNSCNVGILINNLKNDYRENVIVKNVTIQGWANGIIVWRITDDGIIKNSVIKDNGNGIYLFNTKFQEISNNYLLDNQIGINLESTKPEGNDKTFNSKIFNNYISNFVNVSFIQAQQNWWNISLSGTNILGGEPIDGNYWGKPASSPTRGHSETCTCISGFCVEQYNVSGTSNNIDKKPLCSKVFSFGVTPVSLPWNLEIGDNTKLPGFTMDIGSSRCWEIDVLDDDGYLRSLTTNTPLINFMQMKDNKTLSPWKNSYQLIQFSGYGNSQESLDLRQWVEWTDTAGDYQTVLSFTAMEKPCP